MPHGWTHVLEARYVLVLGSRLQRAAQTLEGAAPLGTKSQRPREQTAVRRSQRQQAWPACPGRDPPTVP